MVLWLTTDAAAVTPSVSPSASDPRLSGVIML